MDSQKAIETKPLFRKLFEKPGSLKAHIMEATSVLLELEGRIVESRVIGAWAEALGLFTRDQLILGFSSAVAMDHDFIRPTNVIQPILDFEFAEEFAWLVGALETHGANWADRAGYFDSYESAPNPDPSSTELLRRGVGWHEPRRAPEIPPRLDTALRNFGAGSRTYGLERLAVYLGHESRDAGELARLRSSIEKEFKSAWRLARVAEGNR
jgi:hypothetical protein